MSRLDAYSDDDTKNRMRCECGAAKTRRSQCCERCAYLDGVRRCQSAVIAALRTTGGLNTEEFCAALGIPFSHEGYSQRALMRVLKTLEQRGRVKRYADATDASRTCWRFVLDDRRPA